MTLYGWLALAAVGPAADDERVLERFRPQLRYDSRERHFATAVDGRRHRAAGGERMYGHVVRDGGRVWLQYWLFFAQNTQDRGILATGRHEGDWELVQVRLGRRGEPDAIALSQHSWAQRCDADGAPVVFVANGSHALYSRPGTADRPFPDPDDEADGRGRRARPPVTPIGDDRPEWVRWPGRWGAARARPIPGEQSSPRGPRFQDKRPWHEPAAYHAEARPCAAGPPGRPWALAAGAGALGLAGIALIARRRRARATYNRPR